MTSEELKGKLSKISFINSGVVHYDMNDLVSMNGQFSIDDLRKIINLIQSYLNSQASTSIEEDNADFSNCPNCDETAWDGRICHICGAKYI